MLRRFLPVLVLAACAMAQSEPAKDRDHSQPAAPPSNQAPPRSEPEPAPRGPDDSSSRDATSGPMAEEPEPDDSVTELHRWDPHRAMKDVEIGDYYFKRQNLRAALSRYCEALTYKPSDAVATFRIAEVLDKSGDLAGARRYYQEYLKILPNGPSAGQCKKALDRIQAVPKPADTHLATQHGCEPVGKPARTQAEPFDPNRPVLTRNPTSPASGKSQ
jgi:tetratricopeptide (TPR) repeat protein